MEFNYVIDKDTDIKTFLLSKGFSVRSVNKLLLEKKDVLINQTEYVGNYNLKAGDRLNVRVSDAKTTVKPVEKDIDIVFEDEYILVVNKRADLATIPSRLHYDDNLAGRVLNYFQKTKQNCGIHVLNRLDYMTRGLVVFAKSKHIHYLLSQAETVKKYRFTVSGILSEKKGVINAKILRLNNSVKRAVGDGGKEAITCYKVLKEQENSSFVEAEIKTGRTHQIRVHFAYINHPLLGDTLYGDGKGQFDLCACFLRFYLPINNKEYKFVLKGL